MKKEIEWSVETQIRLRELRYLMQLNKGVDFTQEQKNELMSLYEIEHIHNIKRFGEVLDWLIRTLYEIDPIELKLTGIPFEEYDIEAKIILNELNLRNKNDLREITEVVHEVFVLQFGELAGNMDQPCYVQIAKELMRRKNDWVNK